MSRFLYVISGQPPSISVILREMRRIFNSHTRLWRSCTFVSVAFWILWPGLVSTWVIKALIGEYRSYFTFGLFVSTFSRTSTAHFGDKFDFSPEIRYLSPIREIKPKLVSIWCKIKIGHDIFWLCKTSKHKICENFGSAGQISDVELNKF